MKSILYKQAYSAALASLTKKADDSLKDTISTLVSGGKLYLGWKFIPALAAATALGLGGGYALNRLSRHSDPSVADSGTKEDIDRVERLKRIQYYSALAKQLDSDKNLTKEN
jgi:hypothetical protein